MLDVEEIAESGDQEGKLGEDITFHERFADGGEIVLYLPAEPDEESPDLLSETDESVWLLRFNLGLVSHNKVNLKVSFAVPKVA